MPGFPLARGSAWAGGRDHTPSRVTPAVGYHQLSRGSSTYTTRPAGYLQRWGTTSCREAAPLTPHAQPGTSSGGVPPEAAPLTYLEYDRGRCGCRCWPRSARQAPRSSWPRRWTCCGCVSNCFELFRIVSNCFEFQPHGGLRGQVWHLHRLEPAAYRGDCLAAFGWVVPHSGHDPFAVAEEQPPEQEEEEEDAASLGGATSSRGDCAHAAVVARSCEAWEAFAPHEPFHLPSSSCLLPPPASHEPSHLPSSSCLLPPPASHEPFHLPSSSHEPFHLPTVESHDGRAPLLRLSCDVAATAGRQGGFLWQVRLDAQWISRKLFETRIEFKDPTEMPIELYGPN
jgi:hypothetical protein